MATAHRGSEGMWFSPGTPVSSTNKTDRHDIAEILKVELNAIILTLIKGTLSASRQCPLYTGDTVYSFQLISFMSLHFYLINILLFSKQKQLHLNKFTTEFKKSVIKISLFILLNYYHSTFCIFFFQFEIHASWNDYMVDLRNKSRKPECVLTWIGEY